MFGIVSGVKGLLRQGRDFLYGSFFFFHFNIYFSNRKNLHLKNHFHVLDAVSDLKIWIWGKETDKTKQYYQDICIHILLYTVYQLPNFVI